MVKSSFSPVPGGDARADGKRRQQPRWVHRAISRSHSPALRFSDYVSSRTILAGGCPAVNEEALARPKRARRRLKD